MNTIENRVDQVVSSNEKESIVSKEKLFWTGSIIAAMIASACCWLPLVFVTLGISGIAVSAMFEQYRPIFTILTFGFLAVAFYFTYRPRNKTTIPVTGEECCNVEASTGTDDCCPPRNNAGFNVKRFNKIGLWAVTAIALAFVFFPNYSGFLLAGSNGNPNAVVDNGANEIVVKIDGMTCSACATGLRKKLTGVPGVVNANVSYEKGEARIKINNDNKAIRTEILNAVQAAGFTGSLSSLNQSVINIGGMTCGGCEAHVKSELLKVDGVESAQVSHAKKDAIVTFDPDKVNNTKLKNAVKKAGYEVTGINQVLEKHVYYSLRFAYRHVNAAPNGH